jgi:geranylgeranylglycerol-phosphate geranylgeranyltransferase
MMRSLAVSVARLSRADTSTIVFLSLVIPLYYATSDLHYAIAKSISVLTISMCGFVINDLHDIEKDSQNHPDRPLPRGQISVQWAGVLYFSLLGISLTLVKLYVAPADAFLYLSLLLGLINYNYAVSYFPSTKNLYVAALGLLPVIILVRLLPSEKNYWIVLLALFLFLLGREMLMDINDAKGDPLTLVKKIGLGRSTKLAFAIKIVGLFALAGQMKDQTGVIIFVILVSWDCLSIYLWSRGRARLPILFCMKFELFFGIYYLI